MSPFLYGGFLRLARGVYQAFRKRALLMAGQALPSAAHPPRKPRADATRNHERLLETAKTVFAEKGPAASLDEIAKAAGVGIGTLY
ncbi:TetR family transcriptional regulator, partial [Acidocella sp.]|uniref:TetR family transcriptional regulator n=1 Tax=Acidocella sp. TaxID=50710 RepID=UPI0034504B24